MGKWEHKDTQEYQKDSGQKPDSGKDGARAEHQARQDYQKAGEPFGPLSDRDSSTKQDVPSKK